MLTMGVEQYRELFGLDASEGLHGVHLCTHKRPGGAYISHGYLYIFSSCMVFHVNLAASAKAVRVHFKDVTAICKQRCVGLPGVRVVHADSSGSAREELFAFGWHGLRGKAYDGMSQCWREISPDAAASTRLSRCQTSTAQQASGSIGDDSGDEEEAWDPALPQEPFPRPLQELLLPAGSAAAATAAAAASQPPDGTVVREVAREVLPGDAQQLAQVLLSNSSGFYPHAIAQQQGTQELVAITPWQVVPEGHPSLQPGSLQRTFTYTYAHNTAWTRVRSDVHQEQALLLLDDGRLLLNITQTMPGLPAGVGKVLKVHIGWQVTPLGTAAGCPDSKAADTDADQHHTGGSSSSTQASAGPLSPTPPATPQPTSSSSSSSSSSASNNMSNDANSGTSNSDGGSGSSTGSSDVSRSGSGSDSGGPCVEWRVWVGVQWTGSHKLQGMVTGQTLNTTSASQQALLALAKRWLQQPADRLALQEVMPHSSAAAGQQGAQGPKSSGGRRLGCKLSRGASKSFSLSPTHSSGPGSSSSPGSNMLQRPSPSATLQGHASQDGIGDGVQQAAAIKGVASSGGLLSWFVHMEVSQVVQLLGLGLSVLQVLLLWRVLQVLGALERVSRA